MEVVLIASVLSTSASYVIENILSRCGHRDRATTVHHDSRTQISVGNSEPQESSTAAVDQSPQQHDSVKALEDNLTELRAAARAVNSADTFVQYARLTREANALEERISAMKAESNDSSFDMLRVLQRHFQQRYMQTTPSSSLASAALEGPRLSNPVVLRNVVRGSLFLVLLVYFWNRGNIYILYFDCLFVRPFGWVFYNRLDKLCAESTASCTSVKICAVSYYSFAVLCGIVLSSSLSRFRRVNSASQ